MVILEKEKVELSFKEICDNLDINHQEYLSWEWEYYDTLELLEILKNRKNTFLTSK